MKWVARAPLKIAGGHSSKVARGLLYKTRKLGMKKIGESEWIKGNSILGNTGANIASFAMKKIADTDKIKIGGMTLAEDIAYQNKEEEDTNRIVKQYQGEEGLKERKINRLGVNVNKIEFDEDTLEKMRKLDEEMIEKINKSVSEKSNVDKNVNDKVEQSK